MRARVLVVDDEPDLTNILVRFLRRTHVVEAANCPLEAIERVRDGEPHDLVLCDYHLPRLSGVETLRSIVELRPALLDRVILMTGSIEPMPTTIVTCVGTIRPPLLAKPFGGAELMAALAAITARGAEPVVVPARSRRVDTTAPPW